MNYNIPLLESMAERFNFKVDRRGVWPIMIKGQRAAEYRSHRDALNFISITPVDPAMRKELALGEIRSGYVVR